MEHTSISDKYKLAIEARSMEYAILCSKSIQTTDVDITIATDVISIYPHDTSKKME